MSSERVACAHRSWDHVLCDSTLGQLRKPTRSSIRARCTHMARARREHAGGPERVGLSRLTLRGGRGSMGAQLWGRISLRVKHALMSQRKAQRVHSACSRPAFKYDLRQYARRHCDFFNCSHAVTRRAGFSRAPHTNHACDVASSLAMREAHVARMHHAVSDYGHSHHKFDLPSARRGPLQSESVCYSQ